MRLKLIPIVVCAFGTVPKGLEKRPEQLEIKGRIETLPTIALFRSARILRRVLETWVDSYHLDSSERPPADMGVKNL